MNMQKTVAILLLLLNSMISFSQSKLSPEQRIDTLFSGYNSETPGVSVAVVKDGAIIFQKGYGMANLEYNIPITPQTIFHVASVSKQFTAFSIYLLENQGKISFDDDIRKYIPEVPNFGKPITIKHLLYHTSGLKDQWALLTLAGWRMDDIITTEQILKLVSQQKELNFPTGTQFKYSNTGFTLLAEIVKRVSGKTFAEFTEENIFEPLGMNSSKFYDDHEKIVKNRAYSYGQENGVLKKRILSYSNVGATSLFTTIEDLAKWTKNFENPIVGDSELIKKFNEIAKLDNGEPATLAVIDGETIYHAKGQFFRNYRGLPLFNHTGGDAGYKTYLARFPDKKFSVIALSNDESFSSLKSGLEIAEFYLKDDLKPKIEDKNQNGKDNPIKEFNSNLTEFEGEYYSPELTTTYNIKIRENKLIMSHRKLSDIALTQIGGNNFLGTNTFSFEMEFLRTNEKVVGFEISNFGAKKVAFNKVTGQNNNLINENDLGVQLVKEQLIAYNSRNLEAFILPYSESVEISNFPNEINGKGIEFLKKNYEKLFSDSPNLHCEVLNRIVLGNTVIDHEKVGGVKNLEPFEAIAIYKIENSKISKVYFIRKNK